jgi:septum formation inhibitor MinC
MDKINVVLNKYGSKLSDLSDGLKAQVMELQETIKKYDAALDVYESSDEKDADVDAQLEAMEKYIDENEEVLSNNIEAELAEKARVEKEVPPAEPVEKKEGSAFGWIVAGVAAAVGLGFLFKNKG